MISIHVLFSPRRHYGIGDFHQAPTPPAESLPDASVVVGVDDADDGDTLSTEADRERSP